MRSIFRSTFFLVSTMTALACSSDGGEDTDGSGGTGNTGGSGTGGGGGSGGSTSALDCSAPDYAAIAADTTAVSYATDVLPVFQIACAASTCHCSPDHSTSCGRTPKAGLYLAVAGSDPMPQAAIDDAYANLVDVASTTAPAVMRVAASDPANSFLLHKMSGTQNDQGHTCTVQEPGATPPCGDEMPNLGGGSLCAANPDGFTTVVRWIAQGAQNN